MRPVARIGDAIAVAAAADGAAAAFDGALATGSCATGAEATAEEPQETEQGLGACAPAVDSHAFATWAAVDWHVTECNGPLGPRW